MNLSVSNKQALTDTITEFTLVAQVEVAASAVQADSVSDMNSGGPDSNHGPNADSNSDSKGSSKSNSNHTSRHNPGSVTLPPYTAGAHIDVHLGDEPGTRSYSLIDWTGPVTAPDSYTIAVQREPDGNGGSTQMHKLMPGDTITITAPGNDFELADTTAPALLVAGGIGVTPIISMASFLQQSGKPYHCFYAGRSRGVMAYVNKMEEAFGAYVSVHADDTNPLSLVDIFQTLDPATHVYLCGPGGMLEAARSAAEAAGVPNDQIHIELFAAREAEAGDEAFEVEISSSGEVLVVPPGQTIIEVLEAAGHDLIYDCQRGDCGICQTSVISGTPDHRDVVLSDDERAAGDVMQICVSRAKSNRIVLDL